MSDQYPTQPGPPGSTPPPPAPGGQPGWAQPPSWSPPPGATIQQPPPPPAARPWYKRGWFLLLVGFIAGGIVANTGTDPQATRTVTVTSIVERRVEVPASGKATATTSSNDPGKDGTVLLQASGTGNGNTKRFTAASDWDLRWSFRCNGDGYYSVNPEEANDRALLVGPTGDRTNNGVEHYHEPGRFHLVVITGPNCSWNLRAVSA